MWHAAHHRRLATLFIAASVVGACVQAAASAALLGAPQIMSAKVAHVRVQEATLKGKINAGSNNATWEIQLRSSGNKGAEPELVGAGIVVPGTSQSVSATADRYGGLSLRGNTRYTLTLVVSNRVGETQRSVSFKTRSGPEHE